MTSSYDTRQANRLFTRSRRAAAVLLVPTAMAAVLLAGCGKSDEPSVASIGGPSASPTAADRAQQIELYRQCLVQNGLKLLDHDTAEGLPQIDKEHNSMEKVGTAQEKCRQFLPSGGDVTKPAPDAIEALRKLAECIRAHGVPDYPDPDPATGVTPMSDELAAKLKRDPDLTPAMQACQGQPSPGSGTIGG